MLQIVDTQDLAKFPLSQYYFLSRRPADFRGQRPRCRLQPPPRLSLHEAHQLVPCVALALVFSSLVVSRRRQKNDRKSYSMWHTP